MYIVLVCYRFSSGNLKMRDASNIQSSLYLSLPLPPQPPSPLSPATIHSTHRTLHCPYLYFGGFAQQHTNCSATRRRRLIANIKYVKRDAGCASRWGILSYTWWHYIYFYTFIAMSRTSSMCCHSLFYIIARCKLLVL